MGDKDVVELHDLLDDYLDQKDKNIQRDISSRKEFFDLRAGEENINSKYFNHQDIFKRFMRAYDKLFIIHETGTGKTGSIINLIEYYRNKEKNRFKKVFILEPGPPTVDDFKEQIVKFSDDILEKLRRFEGTESSETLKNNITRIINKYYEVTTYQKFIKDDINDSEIEEYYSDSIFFLDELHKLRNLSDGSGGILTDSQIDKIYYYIWKVFHKAKRCKFILSSATPMMKKVSDFVPLLNLILDSNNQFPERIKEEDFYDSLTLDQLEPSFRGLFSFVRFSGKTDVKIIYKGENLSYTHKFSFPKKNYKGEKINLISKEVTSKGVEYLDNTQRFEKRQNQPYNEMVKKTFKSQIEIFSLEMKPLQEEVFTKVEKRKKQDAFQKDIRQASVFVFPNKTFGKIGFNLYIEKNNLGEYQFKKNILVKGKLEKSLYDFIGDKKLKKEEILKNVNQMSCKFYDFLTRELNSSKNERPGNSFCYLDQVKGSGVILLSLILERLGFENFKSNDFNLVNEKNKKINSRFPKKKRFAILTGETNNLRNSIRVFNSPDNVFGEYIQIIIASEVARDGINLENVVRGYVMSPGWHESGMYQAISRFIRATSHVQLKNTIIEETGKTNPKIPIDIFRYASVKKNEIENFDKGLINFENLSVDLRNYIKAEEKDIKIKRVLRFMKSCSVDAYLNYSRNVKDTDKDGDKSSDYQDKEIEIFNSKGDKFVELEKFTTFDKNYSESKNIKQKIKLNLNSKLRLLSIFSVNDFLKNKRKLNLDKYTLLNYLNLENFNHKIFYDSRNIIPQYLSVFGKNIFVEFENAESYNRYITTERYQIFSLPPNLNEKIEDKDSLKKIYKELENKTEKQIIYYYYTVQNYKIFKELIEESLIKIYNNNYTKFNKKIEDLFYNYIRLINIPEGWLEATKKALTEVSEKKQGRKRMEGSVAGLKDLDLSKTDPKFSKKKTYIHFYRESDKTGFSITSIVEGKSRMIRVLDEGSFRDANVEETFVYRYIFDKFYDKLMKRFRDSKYYGSYIYRGGEQFEDVEKREREFFRIIDTSNPRNKGKVCVNNSAEDVRDILKFIDKEKEYKNLYSSKINKTKVCKIVENLFRKNDLLFISL